MRVSIIIGCLALAGTAAFAQSKQQFQDMQRDIALLHDQLRTIEKSQSDKLDAMSKMLQSAIDNQNKVTGAVQNLQIGLSSQEKRLTTPVATMSSKVDEISNEVGGFREQLAEINSSIRKMQAQMTDIANAIKILQAPPAAPGAPTGGDAPPPGMTAQTLYDGARQAKAAGQLDLALQQFNDYLRYYGQTDLAPNAQFYIGETYYSQQKYDDAIQAFDSVLEKYPEGTKTLDAMYMKGMALARKGDRTAATAEFRALVKQSPSSEQAAKARDQLKRLTAAPTTKKR